jgi:uncharacterized protein YdhG (YjbR/CyaY superfamily)
MTFVAPNPIDEYLSALDEPAASTLAALRATLRELLPDADEALAYGVPAFNVGGKPVAGFAAFKGHLSYFPHSGDVIDHLADELTDYATSKGTLRFPLDQPLPKPLVERLVRARIAEL